MCMCVLEREKERSTDGEKAEDCSLIFVAKLEKYSKTLEEENLHNIS